MHAGDSLIKLPDSTSHQEMTWMIKAASIISSPRVLTFSNYCGAFVSKITIVARGLTEQKTQALFFVEPCLL
jgi:hypothetical protein